MICSGLADRAHDPKWTFAPLSGDGAAVHGGRFNPKGVPALYLATTLEGAVLEASHGFAFRSEPLTICTYELTNMPIADLTDTAFLNRHDILMEDLSSAWFLEASAGGQPASWSIYEKLQLSWWGILVRSFARKARNDMTTSVLWHWADAQAGKIALFDPTRTTLAEKSEILGLAIRPDISSAPIAAA